MAQARIFTDLGFGDSGKGTLVDHAAKTGGAGLVVRYNGGAQAGHNVVQPDGRHHCFSMFGAGTFHGTPTFLSRYVVVDPITISREAHHLVEIGVPALGLLSVDRDAPVSTPFHALINRLRERARGAGRHGSCGLGIGETMADLEARPDLAIYVRDLEFPSALRPRLREIQGYKEAQVKALGLPADTPELARLLDPGLVEDFMAVCRGFWGAVGITDRTLLERYREGNLIFEGAQGVLLDEWHGFHPHTTWSTTTSSNARALLAEAGYRGEVEVTGITRAYLTRHGAGPMPTEQNIGAQDPHNRTHPWQGAFRHGWLDLNLLRYAVAANGGIDNLAVTCLDLAPTTARVATRYAGGAAFLRPNHSRDLTAQAAVTQHLGRALPVYRDFSTTLDALHYVGEELGVGLGTLSRGPTWRDKAPAPGAAKAA